MKWSKKEISYLKENYTSKTNKELQIFLKRSSSSINYKAVQFKLRKSFETLCKSKKHKKIDVTRELIEKLYLIDKKSIRKVASELKLGKNTILHYLKKYNISRRSTSQANKLFYANGGKTWRTGLTKEKDFRISQATEKMRKTKSKLRKQVFKKKEEEFGETLPHLINRLYWKQDLTQEKISQKINLSRGVIIEIMKKENIAKKSNFRVISNLKGKEHSMYGKTWDKLYGKDEADRMRKEYSLRSQKLMVERLKNNKMPFVNTSIEKAIGNEMLKRKIPFISQYEIDQRFVCDFAIPKFRIIVECDGDYWHANPTFYNPLKLNHIQKKKVQTDKNKDIYLSKKGWIVMRFFESEINSSSNACVDIIENQIRKIANPLDGLQNRE